MYKGSSTAHIGQHCGRTHTPVGSGREVFAFLLVTSFICLFFPILLMHYHAICTALTQQLAFFMPQKVRCSEV